MFKSLFLSVTFVFCGSQSLAVMAQANLPPEPRSLASNAEKANLVPEGSERTVVTPEALAESKRLYKQGVKYGRAGLFRQAAETFERALKLNPDYADAYASLGHAYVDLEQWDKAVDILEKALALDPKDKESRARLDQAQVMSRSAEKKTETPIPDVSTQPTSTSPTPTSAPANEDVKPKVSEVNPTTLYRVGPGDVLDIRLNDASQVKSTLFTITPAGLLEHPNLAEPLSISGLTVNEIAAKIETDLKRRALSSNPRVSVGVRDYVSHTILVSGLVKETGTKILRREAIPLYVVVADAQPLPEAAIVSVVRNETSEVFEIDLTESAKMNLLVRPGDVITVQPNATQYFYVAGPVKSPGEKTFRRGMTLTQAIIAAGGLVGKSGEIKLGRDDGKGFLVVNKYKLKDIESGKVPDPLIQPGDRITIVE